MLTTQDTFRIPLTATNWAFMLSRGLHWFSHTSPCEGMEPFCWSNLINPRQIYSRVEISSYDNEDNDIKLGGFRQQLPC